MNKKISNDNTISKEAVKRIIGDKAIPCNGPMIKTIKGNAIIIQKVTDTQFNKLIKDLF